MHKQWFKDHKKYATTVEYFQLTNGKPVINWQGLPDKFCKPITYKKKLIRQPYWHDAFAFILKRGCQSSNSRPMKTFSTQGFHPTIALILKIHGDCVNEQLDLTSTRSACKGDINQVKVIHKKNTIKYINPNEGHYDISLFAICT